MGELRFPNGFLWGVATSSHQIEGGNHNDWTKWEKRPGHPKNVVPSGDAADHWHRYADDYQYISDMNLSAYRFSIEWSRIEPRAGEYDAEAIAHYGKMLAELGKRGITPMVTLHHFTSPLWIDKIGGWADPRTVDHFVRFATKVIDAFGADVSFWITLNEPSVQSGLGYMVGIFPPGRKDLLRYWHARRNMLDAHRAVYRLTHEMYKRRGWRKPQVSFAHHMTYVEAANPDSLLDRLSARIYDYFNNSYFLSHAKGYMDFVGVNYYFYRRMRFQIGGPLAIMAEVPLPDAPASDLGWQVVPGGLYSLCKTVAAYGLPIYITENGLADATDRLRPWSLVHHARAIHRAISEGADVRGYFHWTLIDSFEWENGFGYRYGLVAVDYATQERTPRGSAKLYGEIAAHNAVTAEMMEKYS
jgi:beta-glucosidase